MSLTLASRIARRDMRGGFGRFRVFLACLTLGVATIAAVGSVREGIETAIAQQGAALLGGDAQLEFTYRTASAEEAAWMAQKADAVSEIIDFRSMAVVRRGETVERGLTQVKAVDDLYPLTGQFRLDPDMPLADALATQTLPGAVMERALIDRLGLAIGDRFELGTQRFELRAQILSEPDNAGDAFGLGPRTLVLSRDLAASGLIGAGTLFSSKYRLRLPDSTALSDVQSEAETLFRDTGMRWQDRRDGAPGISEFVIRLGDFLVLVGLAGLAVGGVGVSAAVRAYLGSKTATIATLRTLGAGAGLVFQIYGLQILTLSVLGTVAGLILGGGLPFAFAPLITAALPFPIEIKIAWAALAEAALYGILTAILFALWPLARTEGIRPAALYRGGISGFALPRPRYLLAIAAVLVVLVGAAAGLSTAPELALWAAGGIAGALLILVLVALVLRALSRRMSQNRRVRGRPSLRLALAAIGGPGEGAVSVVLSLGLGLSVLATLGQVDSNLRAAIDRDLPTVAPSYFFVDIQTDQMPGFLDRLNTDPQVSNVETAPMLRGVITRINGVPAREAVGEHWVISGDRGITYSATPTEQTEITDGAWWPEDYSGPPQISFSQEEATEMGLQLGDTLTVNVLGRDIEAEITSFRVVDFSTAGIGFILSMNPSALAGAPHTHIATVYAEPEAETAILRDLAGQFPNITAIRVGDAIDRVTAILSSIASAVRYGATTVLLTGFVVLIGAAAAGEATRTHEAAVLKTLGATRRRILGSFALRSVLMGAASGMVALATGIGFGWALMTFVMEVEFSVDLPTALWVIGLGIAITVLAGLAFTLRPLSARPAQVLRTAE